jgi:hypothetical protein
MAATLLRKPKMFNAPAHNDPARQELCLAAAALDAAEVNGDAYGMSQALVKVARSHAALRALASAESHLEAALRWARVAGSTDATVDLLCELCDMAERLAQTLDKQRRGKGHAARERARDHAFEASTLAGRVADPSWEIRVLLRISDVLDRCGDRDDAVQMQARALRLMAGPAAEAHNPHVMPGLGRLADQ